MQPGALRCLIANNAMALAIALTIGFTFPFWARYAAAGLYAVWLLGGGQ